eukprot:SAG25_NODE_4490_length_803_cov_2.166193_1_plen_148_part_00
MLGLGVRGPRYSCNYKSGLCKLGGCCPLYNIMRAFPRRQSPYGAPWKIQDFSLWEKIRTFRSAPAIFYLSSSLFRLSLSELLLLLLSSLPLFTAGLDALRSATPPVGGTGGFRDPVPSTTLAVTIVARVCGGCGFSSMISMKKYVLI